MSKKSRTRAAAKRKKEKVARKQQMKMQYQQWRDEGITKASKRSRKRSEGERKKIGKKRQRIPFPIHLWVKDDGSLKPGTPHKIYLAWKAQNV